MSSKLEHAEQVDFIQMVRKLYDRWPALRKLLFAIPNGGDRNTATALRMQAEGVRRGIPDMCCAIPVGKWHGAYIEHKRVDGGQPSKEQKECLGLLAEQGYFTAVAWGAEDLFAILLAYLENRVEGMPFNGSWHQSKNFSTRKVK